MREVSGLIYVVWTPDTSSEGGGTTAREKKKRLLLEWRVSGQLGLSELGNNEFRGQTWKYYLGMSLCNSFAQITHVENITNVYGIGLPLNTH